MFEFLLLVGCEVLVVEHCDLAVVRLEEDGVLEVRSHVHRGLVGVAA